MEALREGLEEAVKKQTVFALPAEYWEQIQKRKEDLDRWRMALEGLAREMHAGQREGFDLLVDREATRPFQRLRDLMTLRQITEKPDDPVLLMKGALLGEEMLNEASLENLLRRTRPTQMVRYFLPEINARFSHQGQKGMDIIYQVLSPLCGTKIELVIAQPGDAFDVKRHHIAGQDTTGAQPRDRIVQCLALGLRDPEIGTIEPKAKIIISG